jgi:hypothetical protein
MDVVSEDQKIEERRKLAVPVELMPSKLPDVLIKGQRDVLAETLKRLGRSLSALHLLSALQRSRLESSAARLIIGCFDRSAG